MEEASPNDLECGGDGDDAFEERRTDGPSRGPADERDEEEGSPAESSPNERAVASERDDDDEGTASGPPASDVEAADERDEEGSSPPESSPKEGAVDSERDDDEGTASGCCAATAMVLAVWGVAIALLSVALGLGPGRLRGEGPPCTLCGEDGLGLSEIDEATAFPTRRPSAAAPDHGASIIFAL